MKKKIVGLLLALLALVGCPLGLLLLTPPPSPPAVSAVGVPKFAVLLRRAGCEPSYVLWLGVSPGLAAAPGEAAFETSVRSESDGSQPWNYIPLELPDGRAARAIRRGIKAAPAPFPAVLRVAYTEPGPGSGGCSLRRVVSYEFLAPN